MDAPTEDRAAATGRTALYRLYDAEGALLYVGITSDPYSRWSQHAIQKIWWGAVAIREIEWLATREAAAAAEVTAIREEMPLHNYAHNPAWSPLRKRRGQEKQGERSGNDGVSPEYEAIYEETEDADELAQMVYDRRTELGLSQAQLAKRAGMTQPQMSRLEGGGTVPTVPLMRRLAAALDCDLVVRFASRQLDGSAGEEANLIRVFPWVRLLSPEAMRGFLAEFMGAVRAASATGRSAPLFSVVAAWRATAEAYAGPDPHAQLTRTDGGDCGPVEPPRDAPVDE